MDSHFAPAERVSQTKLASEIFTIDQSPVLSGLLHSIGGLLAILDDHRQILAINDSFLEMLGIDDPEKALGLRLGEVLHCPHSKEEPNGCGTTEHCSTCGAAIAIVAAIEGNTPVERICAIKVTKNGQAESDIALLVRSNPIVIQEQRFILLFMQDITVAQRRAALERTFFHDINNMLSLLVGSSELLVEANPSDLAKNIQHASLRLIKEVEIQRILSTSTTSQYQPVWQEYNTDQIFSELHTYFDNHPGRRNKTIEFTNESPEIVIKTDLSLLMRVLCNIILNALEASQEGGLVKVWIEKVNARIFFHIWNAQEIPSDIAGRIFQRNFSTKNQAGRGIGTYSMKLFGEEILNGKVSFKTSPKGTVFSYSCVI